MLNPQLDRRPVSMMRRAALAAHAAGDRAADRRGVAGGQHAVRAPSRIRSGRPLADATVRLTAIDSDADLRNQERCQRRAFSSPPFPPATT